MGERFLPALLVCALFGCGEVSRQGLVPSAAAPQTAGAGIGATAGRGGGGAGGAVAGGSASGAGGSDSDDSRTWAWTHCGTIPSTPQPIETPREPGSAIAGGHPFMGESHYQMTGLAISADGRTLVSMGGVTLVWDVGNDFASSSATFVTGAAPERPKVNISPDGSWIAISGDGRIVYSRSGARNILFGSSFDTPDLCFPIEVRFSPDGQWLAGAGWGGAIDVFRLADIETFDSSSGGTPDPVVSFPASCAPNSGYGAAMRSAFTPDGQTLVTEAGDRYRTSDWQVLVNASREPLPHGLWGGFEVSAEGRSLVSDCTYESSPRTRQCGPYAAPFPKFSPEGRWVVAGGILSHVASGEKRVLDPTALVGIFAPNGNVIAAGADNSLTRYCKSE